MTVWWFLDLPSSAVTSYKYGSFNVLWRTQLPRLRRGRRVRHPAVPCRSSAAVRQRGRGSDRRHCRCVVERCAVGSSRVYKGEAHFSRCWIHPAWSRPLHPLPWKDRCYSYIIGIQDIQGLIVLTYNHSQSGWQSVILIQAVAWIGISQILQLV